MSMTDLRRTGRDTWIPWAFVGFFLVVFAVNGAMMTIAFKTWTGLDTENAYQEGLAYNDRLAEVARGLSVDDLVAATGIGRRSLERPRPFR